MTLNITRRRSVGTQELYLNKSHSSSHRGKSKGASFDVQDNTTVVDFRQIQFLSSNTSSSGYVEGHTDLTAANTGVRGAQVSTDYEYFRFNKLRIKAIMNCLPVSSEVSGATVTNPGCAFSIAFSPFPLSDMTSTPMSFVDMAQMNAFDMVSCLGRARLTIPKKILRSNPVKWFRTRPTSANTDDLSAGIVEYLIHTSTAVANPYLMWITIEGEIEFRGQVSNAVSFTSRPDVPVKRNEDDDQKSDCSDPTLVDYSAPYAPHE